MFISGSNQEKKNVGIHEKYKIELILNSHLTRLELNRVKFLDLKF